MNWVRKLFKKKAFALSINKTQKALLECFITNKADFDNWLKIHPQPKIKFQFYYPTAVDFFYSEFKLFTAYFKKSKHEHLELLELKMSETNFDTIRCANWTPFEEVIIEFLSSLEENKKIALFDKRKVLFEYEALCAKTSGTEPSIQKDYLDSASSLLPRKPSRHFKRSFMLLATVP